MGDNRPNVNALDFDIFGTPFPNEIVQPISNATEEAQMAPSFQSKKTVKVLPPFCSNQNRKNQANSQSASHQKADPNSTKLFEDSGASAKILSLSTARTRDQLLAGFQAHGKFESQDRREGYSLSELLLSLRIEQLQSAVDLTRKKKPRKA